MAVGALVSALALCAPTAAQQSTGDISQRIENTFALVLGNSAELAIPLTRRALARRFSKDHQAPDSSRLAYTGTEDTVSDGPASTASIGDAAAPPASVPIAIAAPEDPADPDIARLPRPRPEGASQPAADGDAMGGPLDLVAGAAAPGTEPVAEMVASSDAEPADAPDLSTEVANASVPAPAALPPGPPAELVATGSCLSPEEVADKDGDFKRNADALTGNGFCIAEATFKERRRSWHIATVKSGRPGPLFAVMHDDEDMSFDTAVAALKTYGGTLVAVDTGGKRNQDGIDPNRNFSADGVGCKKLGNDATPEYTAIFRGLFDASQPIIALHNNTGARIPTGGLGHVTMADVPKDMEKHASADPDGPLAGERALVLLTSPIPVSTTSKNEAEMLKAKGINALIEKVDKGKGDCSLSNYTLLTGYPDYLNVTVDKGEGDKQRKIIDAIMAARSPTVATQ